MAELLDGGVEISERKGMSIAHGNVAQKLLACNMSPKALRTNDTLTYDQWKEIDRVILEEARRRTGVVNDLVGRGLTYNIPSGLAKTVLQFQDASDIEAAEITMDGVTEGKRDRKVYSTKYLPLPIVFKDLFFTAREIAAARNGEQPLDVDTVALATRVVLEKVEEIVIAGSSSYTYGGGTIYGLQDFTHRNTVTLSVNWSDSAATGDTVINDVISMKQALINDRFFGPYGIYIPSTYETVLDKDFKTNSDKSIRQRLMEIEGVEFVKVNDFLTANNVVMFQLTTDVIRLVNALPLQVVEWSTDGGMKVFFKVMTILVPQIRADKANRCGVVHLL